jgi:phosphate-selective porin OprO/OprP
LLPARTSIQGSENDEASLAASAVFLELNDGVVASGDRLQGAIHTALYAGPVSIEAEWNALSNQLLNENNGEVLTVGTTGYHVTVASFLTGETVTGREVVQPLRPFDPRCGCSHFGAIEAFARISYLSFGDKLFGRDLADPDEWTDEVTMTDIGFNWYLNRYTKFYIDWQHAAFASPVLIDAARDRFSTYNDLYWARCQVYF